MSKKVKVMVNSSSYHLTYTKPVTKNKHPIPSTFDVYKPGIGFTITKKNIEDYQAGLAENHKPDASPEQIVNMFASMAEQEGRDFKSSKTYKRRLGRAMRLMNRG